MFLKKSSQNICKFEINALPLQSLSLQNKNGASEKEFIDRLAQTREQHGRLLFSDRFWEWP